MSPGVSTSALVLLAGRRARKWATYYLTTTSAFKCTNQHRKPRARAGDRPSQCVRPGSGSAPNWPHVPRPDAYDKATFRRNWLAVWLRAILSLPLWQVAHVQDSMRRACVAITELRFIPLPGGQASADTLALVEDRLNKSSFL